jgi:hypothetical protein
VEELAGATAAADLIGSRKGSQEKHKQDDNQQERTAANIHFELLLVAHALREEEHAMYLNIRTPRRLFAGVRTGTVIGVWTSIIR